MYDPKRDSVAMIKINLNKLFLLKIKKMYYLTGLLQKVAHLGG